MYKHNTLLEEGKFITGCNYWASHAGTNMWSDWRPDVVEKDFEILSSEGLKILRVFPLWPDFQPVDKLNAAGGQFGEYTIGEFPLPDTQAGSAGMSAQMIERFREFTKIADKYNIKIIVGLITGWMSGRLFTPPLLKDKNVIDDDLARMWQMRFVKHFVLTFKDCQCITAWDLGNECNVMGEANSRESAWVWAACLTNTIRAMDNTRPVISGMHSLLPKGTWTMQDQGELCDILTTHPYPFWTAHSKDDPVNTIRPILHATAESLFYSGIGGKPCFAEEIGTMGPMVAGENQAAAFIRASMLNLWAHDCRALLWWCSSDQTSYTHAPYSWNACERELGLVTEDGRKKEFLLEIGRLNKMIKSLPFESLPHRSVEAVCIIGDLDDTWGAAYSSFVLAKQAGFDIEYQFEDQPVKDAQLYLLPSITGCRGMKLRRWKALLEKVQSGASLYISFNDGYIAEFEKVSGLSVNVRSKRNEKANIRIGEKNMVLGGAIRLDLTAKGGEVLGTEADGNPAFTCCNYGKGKIFFFAFPLEIELLRDSCMFSSPEADSYAEVYKIISRDIRKTRLFSEKPLQIGITEHTVSDSEKIAVMVNLSPEKISACLKVKDGWEITKTLYGKPPENTASQPSNDHAYNFSFPANDGVIAVFRKK